MMADKRVPHLKKVGEKTRITSDNAKAMQRKGAATKRAKRTLYEALKECEDKGILEDVAVGLLNHKDGNLRFKMLELFSKLDDRFKARENGELDNKVFVYEPMQFTKVDGK